MATQTKREEFQALQQAMAEEQEVAVLELNDWFHSDEGKAFAEKMIAIRERTIPNGHYDQIMTSFLSVAGNVEKLAQQAADVAATKKAADEAAAESAQGEAPESEKAGS